MLDSLQEEVVPVNRVLIDYLTIHFFSNQHLKLIEEIIEMPIERFEELDYWPIRVESSNHDSVFH